MQLVRPAIALDPRRFGRGGMFVPQPAAPASASSPSSDLRLFATTFAAGFLFVSLLIA